jgi:uncharacterized RDD family membrane protein YckC
MICDLQKASLLKRASAFLLDLILLCILTAGAAFGISALTGYDTYNDRMDALQAQYEQQYGVSFHISEQDYAKLDETQKQQFDEAQKAFTENDEVIYLYNMQINLILLISSISILTAYVILELIIPICFKNGQTVGKKIFGIALMRTDGVKMSGVALFARTILGKYTIETMVPLYIILMIAVGAMGLTGTIVLFLILVLQIGLMIITKTNSAIHDVLAVTVAVDLASQMIFESEEAMIEYKKKIHAEQVESSKY